MVVIGPKVNKDLSVLFVYLRLEILQLVAF